MKWINRKSKPKDEVSRLRALDPYELLNLPPNASNQAIRIAYKKMAKIYHPDKADPFMRKYNEEVMKIVNQAYSQLTGSAKKSK